MTQAPRPIGTEASDRLPRRFGRYHLFDRIGRGGMADIYLALASTELGASRRVVVKQILEELCHDAEFSKLLVEEAKLVADLRHANVAQVLDLGREGARLFIAMEYVEGFDLNQLLRQLSKNRIPLPAEFALFAVREILAALDFAHRRRDDAGELLGIVHCDVSPSNVLISFEGEVKLCDFGIAKAYGSAGSGGAQRVAGKAAYMSPEHARGEALDARADLFSVGIILHELCAGRRLYKGTEEQMLEMAKRAEIPPLPNRGLMNQADLQAVLDRALAVDPGQRWQSAAQMLRALDDYAMGAKLLASQIRFGSFLSDHFEEAVVLLRRERERAAAALELGPPLQIAVTDPLGAATLDETDARPQPPEPVSEPDPPVAEPAAKPAFTMPASQAQEPKDAASLAERPAPPPEPRSPARMLLAALIGIAIFVSLGVLGTLAVYFFLL